MKRLVARGGWGAVAESPATREDVLHAALTGGAARREDQLLDVLEAERVPHAAVNLPGDLTPTRGTSARHAGAGLDAPVNAQLEAVVGEADLPGWRVLVAAVDLGDAGEGADAWASFDAALGRALDAAGESPHMMLAFPTPEGGSVFAAGPGIGAGARGPADARWEDVAVTALAWLRIPPPAGMQGAEMDAFLHPPEWPEAEERRVREHLEGRGSL